MVKDKSQSVSSPCQLFSAHLIRFASDAQSFLRQYPKLSSNPFTQSVLLFLESVDDPKPGRVSRGILPIVQAENLWQNPTPINFNIKMFTAEITDPYVAKSIENIVKVTAILIAILPVTAEIENLQQHQRQDLQIKVKYPDQNIQVSRT